MLKGLVTIEKTFTSQMIVEIRDTNMEFYKTDHGKPMRHNICYIVHPLHHFCDFNPMSLLLYPVDILPSSRNLI